MSKKPLVLSLMYVMPRIGKQSGTFTRLFSNLVPALKMITKPEKSLATQLANKLASINAA